MKSYIVVIHRTDGFIERIIPEGNASAPVQVCESGGWLRIENIAAPSESDAVAMARGKRLEIVNRGRAPHVMVDA